MNINRNNYEVFFLLYVDNELSVAERNAVELFVQKNADLKEELHQLQETVMLPTDITFVNKNSLLKRDTAVLQENLLLYIDDELSAEAKLDTEKLLQSDIAAQAELTVLQQTRLKPDTAIVFTDKNVLYRKEKAKVIGMPWKQIAAAAVLLGFGTWLALSVIKTGNKQEAVTGIATNNTPAKTATAVQAPGEATVTAQDKKTADTNIAVNGSSDHGAVKSTTAKNELPVKEKILQQVAIAKVDNNSIATQQEKEIKKLTNNLPTPVYKNINKPESNYTAGIDVTQRKTVIDNGKSGNEITSTVSNNSSDAIEGYALNTKFTEGEEAQEEDRSKKSKLGGFFRKVKRMVERNTNVQSGNGVKIAGFDIAIK